MALRLRGLFLKANRLAIAIEFDHTVCGRISHPVSENGATVYVRVPPQLSTHAAPIEDVVS
jgi:hypothetical protein